MDINYGGTQLVTADAVIGASGRAVRIYSIHILSGASGGVVLLRSGSSASDTIYIQETGTASDGRTVPFGQNGFFFPSGAYCDIDANTTSVLVSYSIS